MSRVPPFVVSGRLLLTASITTLRKIVGKEFQRPWLGTCMCPRRTRFRELASSWPGLRLLRLLLVGARHSRGKGGLPDVVRVPNSSAIAWIQVLITWIGIRDTGVVHVHARITSAPRCSDPLLISINFVGSSLSGSKYHQPFLIAREFLGLGGRSLRVERRKPSCIAMRAMRLKIVSRARGKRLLNTTWVRLAGAALVGIRVLIGVSARYTGISAVHDANDQDACE